MKDDAVAPVVAAMLVLAVVVTIFSVWNAIYLPSLKQQSEMMQDREVQEAFNRFASDISNAASLKRDLSLRQTLPLGGGGVMFSPLSSAGTIQAGGEPHQLYNITVRVDNTNLPPIDHRLVNFSYRPSGDFWLDQGYTWHYGYVNVTKGSSPTGADRAALSAMLDYATMNQLNRSPFIRKFAGVLVTADDSRPWYNSSKNATHITISSVTYRTDPGATYVSGNGIGTFTLTAVTNETEYGVTDISSPDAFNVFVNRVSPEVFPLSLYIACNQSFAELARKYPGNVMHGFESAEDYKRTNISSIPGSLPFTITHRQIAVNVSVQ